MTNVSQPTILRARSKHSNSPHSTVPTDKTNDIKDSKPGDRHLLRFNPRPSPLRSIVCVGRVACLLPHYASSRFRQREVIIAATDYSSYGDAPQHRSAPTFTPHPAYSTQATPS